MQFKLKATNSAEETQLYWKTEFFCEKRCNLFGKFFAREQNEINHEWKRGEIWKAPALENKRLFCLAGHYFSKEKAEKEMWRQKKPRCVKRIQKRKKEKSECKGDQLIFFSTIIGGSKVKKKERTKERGAVAAATDWPLFDQVQATHLASRISMTSLSLFHSSRLYLTKRFFSLGSRVL